MNYSSITLISRKNISPDSVILQFTSSNPDHLTTFKSGQYLSFKFLIKNQEEIRPYSILQKISNNEFTIALKKVNKGKVSNYLIHEIQAGTIIKASEPEGRFFIEAQEEKRSQHFFLSAGIGITPLYSMMHELVEQEAKSEVYLLYGNRKKEDILFYEEFQSWENKYEGQFFPTFSLTQSSSGFSFFKKSESWQGLKGRIDYSKIQDMLAKHLNNKLQASFYICGPEQFNIDTENNLLKLGIAQHQIHKEFFFLEKSTSPAPSSTISGNTKITVHLEGKTHALEIPKGKLIVEELMRHKINPPYSCSSGACATCVAKLLKGEVRMDNSMALEPDEIKQGYILTCQSRPLTDEIEIKY